ncbi:MAG: restriction endonuclease subunit S [Patescibacteria group bacterium]
MNQNLSDTAEIISGYSFRGAVPHDPQGSFRVVQVKDINEHGHIETARLSPIEDKGIKTDALLQKNDILLSIRGTGTSGMKVGMYTCTDNHTIATSSLYVLRIKDKTILPGYLLYYLRSFYGQHALKNMMSGATVRSILKKDLFALSIPTPPIKQQQLVVDTATNLIKQKQLLSQKIFFLNSLSDNIISIYT